MKEKLPVFKFMRINRKWKLKMGPLWFMGGVGRRGRYFGFSLFGYGIGFGGTAWGKLITHEAAEKNG